MKLKLILLFILLIFNQASLFSQEREGEEDGILEHLERDYSEAGIYVLSNIAIIRQVGFENVAVANQQNDGLSANYYVLNQTGTGNNGYINQDGNSLVTQVLQNGQNNIANSWSVGNSTFTEIKQDGVSNTVNNYIENQGHFTKEALLEQNGNNNSIDIELLGNGFWSESFLKAAEIKQTGNNLEFNAVMDSYNSPVVVHQQSGTSGGGMTVNISNSAFNFPTK